MGRPPDQPSRMNSASLSAVEQQLQPLLLTFRASSRRVIRSVIRRLEKLPLPLRVDAEAVLSRAARSLAPLAAAFLESVVTPESEVLGGRSRNGESLIERLCRNDWLPHDLTIPTGALVRRALMIARVNFLKSLRYSLEPSESTSMRSLLKRVRELEEHGILCKLAEELLTFAVANHRNSVPLRKAAAHRLLRLWNNHDDQALDDFPNVLLSAWKARSRVRTIYGTLFGSGEILSLMRCECEPRFVNFFTRDQVTPGQTQAFREFLFGLPHEELLILQKHMETHDLHVISRDQVQDILGREATYTPTMGSEPTAEEIFASYYRRRLRADYRVLSGSPGPDKTAEGYMMEALLREECGIPPQE